jgi:hypothetical protein
MLGVSVLIFLQYSIFHQKNLSFFNDGNVSDFQISNDGSAVEKRTIITTALFWYNNNSMLLLQ